MADMPQVGDSAPDIRLQGIGGKEWSLGEQRGKAVVLLFYVLDWTPG
jgi:peroxiredoxin